MVQQLIHQRRRRLLGLAAALVVVAPVATTATAGAAGHARPDCQRGAVCLYQNAKWNQDPVLRRTDRGQQLDFLVDSHDPVTPVMRGYILNPNRRDHLPPDRSRIPGRSLVNRVSSYANFSKSPYCIYDENRNGEPVFLWRMAPGSSSSFVGERLNDRADTMWPCDVKLVPGD
jgi:hypothetical protein